MAGDIGTWVERLLWLQSIIDYVYLLPVPSIDIMAG
jgi:hypothetical protein